MARRGGVWAGAVNNRLSATDRRSATDWFFAPAPFYAFDVIVIDCPWEYVTYSAKGLKKSPQAHYRCMTIEDIAGLPVRQLARPDCALFMWGTWPMLNRQMRILEGWGFVYKTGFPWIKRTVRGKRAFGPGHLVRECSEPIFVGAIGRAGLDGRRERGLLETIVDGAMGAHSVKPVEFYDKVERLVPGARKIDVFARAPRSGWTVWGDEVSEVR